jgi:hypothetical protein
MIGLEIERKTVPITLEVKEYIGEANSNKDYENLYNKPQINGITLEGDKSLEEIGIIPLDDSEISQITEDESEKLYKISESILKPLDENGLVFLWKKILLKFVAKEEGKGLSENNLTNEILQKISDSGNYLLLTDKPKINGIELTENKTLEDLGIIKAINDKFGEITQISFKVAQDFKSLPLLGESGVFYLIPNDGSAPNRYDEYIWDSATFSYELLGTIQNEVDLSGYVKTEDIIPMTNEEILEIINAATTGESGGATDETNV